MNDEIFFCIVLVGGVSFFALYALGVTMWYNYHNKKFVKNHPDYIALQNEVSEKGRANWEWRELINQKKKAIDEALAEIPYATEQGQAKIMATVGVWRVELEVLNNEARPHFEEHILLRDKLNKWHDELVASGELKEF